MRPQIYIDTSVIGGYYDDKFEEPKKNFLDELPTKISLFTFQKLTKQNSY
jgi:hypothetical protein